MGGRSLGKAEEEEERGRVARETDGGRCGWRMRKGMSLSTTMLKSIPYVSKPSLQWQTRMRIVEPRSSQYALTSVRSLSTSATQRTLASLLKALSSRWGSPAKDSEIRRDSHNAPCTKVSCLASSIKSHHHCYTSLTQSKITRLLGIRSIKLNPSIQTPIRPTRTTPIRYPTQQAPDPNNPSVKDTRLVGS